MNSVQDYVVMNGALDRVHLSNLLDILNKKHFVDLDHVIAILFGLERMLDDSDFPKKSFTNENRAATFKEYNVLSDTVTYDYPLVCERWFATEDERDRFVGGESYFGMNYSCNEDDAHKFFGVRSLNAEGVCSSAVWLKNAVEE